jgi:hypothetical protein
VAEDVPELKRFLKVLPRGMRDRPFFFPPNSLVKTEKDRQAGYSTQSGRSGLLVSAMAFILSKRAMIRFCIFRMLLRMHFVATSQMRRLATNSCEQR